MFRYIMAVIQMRWNCFSIPKWLHEINSFLPSRATWWHRSGWKSGDNDSSDNGWLPNGMKPWLELMLCWFFFISEVLWHSPESNFAIGAQATFLYNRFEIILLISYPQGQWVIAGGDKLSYVQMAPSHYLRQYWFIVQVMLANASHYIFIIAMLFLNLWQNIWK